MNISKFKISITLQKHSQFPGRTFYTNETFFTSNDGRTGLNTKELKFLFCFDRKLVYTNLFKLHCD